MDDDHERSSRRRLGQFQTILKEIERNYRIESLELSDLDITDDKIRQLQFALQNYTRCIEELDCSFNPNVTIEGYRILCNIVTSRNSIVSLDLSNNGITNTIAQLVATTVLQQQQSNHHLKRLDLSDNENIGVDGFLSIIRSLESNTVLESLNMDHTLRTDIETLKSYQIRIGQAFDPVLRTVRNKTTSNLQSLHIVNDGLGDNFIMEFANALKSNRSLRKLYLGGRLSIVGFTPFAKSLRYHPKLVLLDLDKVHSITDDCIVTLYKEGLEYNTSIKTINMWESNHCTFQYDTIKSIVSSLEYNDTLEEMTCYSPTIGHIVQLLDRNHRKQRTAPKKGLRQRYDIYHWLYTKHGL